MEAPPFLHQPLLFRDFPLSSKTFGTHPPQVTKFWKSLTLPPFNNVGGGEWEVGFQLCGLKAKKIKLHQMNFFPVKQLIKFSCIYGPLSKKISGLIQWIQSYEDWRFLGPNWPICHERIILVQTIIITCIYLLALSLFKILKNCYSGSRIIRMGNYWT